MVPEPLTTSAGVIFLEQLSCTLQKNHQGTNNTNPTHISKWRNKTKLHPSVFRQQAYIQTTREEKSDTTWIDKHSIGKVGAIGAGGPAGGGRFPLLHRLRRPPVPLNRVSSLPWWPLVLAMDPRTRSTRSLTDSMNRWIVRLDPGLTRTQNIRCGANPESGKVPESNFDTLI